MKPSGEKPVILVVDDVPGNIKALKAILAANYKLLVATNGPDALEIVASKPVDLILLDVVMPKMDGFEVCRCLQANHETKDIPLIFVTAQQDEVDETMAFELGAVDYITKPFSPAVVQVRILTQIRIRSLNRSLEQSNQFIRKTFGRYMSDEVVENILDTPEGLLLGGERKLVTVMMTDLRGFTAIGDRLLPEEVISMLNMYLETMTEIILKYKGTIIEFLGDGILVVFGTPVTRDDDVQRAVACALEMQLAMPEVNVKNLEAGFPEVAMGCGINTGQVVAGNIGSDLRSKYGVVGNAINLASRIESFTVGGQILVSDSTMQGCSAQLRVDDDWSVQIKGVSHPMTLYQIGGIAEPYSIQLPEPKNVALKSIPNGIAVRLTIMEGKRANLKFFGGTITEMDPPLVIVKTELKARRLTNLQIELVDCHGQSITDQLYGKVVGEDEKPGYLKIQFTSIHPEADQTFRQVLGDGSN
jgi:adenylate cyclase